MDTRSLKAFCLVARHSTLSRAAGAMRLSSAAISLQIKKLEVELGFSLFNHRPNKLALTDEGERFLEVATRILEELDSIREITVGKRESRATKITISMSNDSARFFSPAITSFIKKQPGLSTSILLRPSPITLSSVMKGEADLGLGHFESVPQEMHKQELIESCYVLIFPRTHALARKADIGLGDLVAHPLIVSAQRTSGRRSIDSAFSRSGIQPQHMVEVSNCYMTTEYISLGLGIGLVHDNCLSSEMRKMVRCADVSGLFEKEKVSLIYRQAAPLGELHHALINTLIQYARKKG